MSLNNKPSKRVRFSSETKQLDGHSNTLNPDQSNLEEINADNVADCVDGEDMNSCIQTEKGIEPFHMENERASGWFRSFNMSGRTPKTREELDEEDDEQHAEAWLKEWDAKGETPIERHIVSEDTNDIVVVDVTQLRTTLIKHLLKGESVLAAIRRLGVKDTVTGKANAMLDVVTEAANALLSEGHYDVYQDTRELLERCVARQLDEQSRKRVRDEDGNDEDDDEDIFRDEDIAPKSSRLVTTQTLQPEQPQWYYKMQLSDTEIHGPYSAKQMNAWRAQGFFVGAQSVFVRNISSPSSCDNDDSSSWTNSTHIDTFSNT